MRIVTAFLLFFLTWLLWSGHYIVLVVFLGLLSCVLVTVLAWRTGFFERELYGLHIGPRLPRYWLWLLQELVVSNFTVARIVLHPRLPIQPCITRIDARSLPVVSQATLANAITLTPGTLSVDVNGGIIEVHCLTAAAAAQLEEGEMVRRATRLTGG